MTLVPGEIVKVPLRLLRAVGTRVHLSLRRNVHNPLSSI